MAVGKILKTIVKGGKRLRKPVSVKENFGKSVAGDVIAPSKRGLKGDLGGKNIPDTFKKSKTGTDKSKIENALTRLRYMKKKKTITDADKRWRTSTSKQLARGKTENTTALIRILEARLKKIKEIMHKKRAQKIKESGGEKSLHGQAKQLTKKEMEDAGFNVSRKHGGQIGKPRGTGAALRGYGKGYKKD